MSTIIFLAQAAIMAVVALGAWTAMGEGMILSFVTRWAEKLPKWMAKPLATCPRCMCSVWGIVALLALGYDFSSTWNIVQLPVLILAAVGIQELLYRP
jgi:ABC-type phosphate transport system permease subunit